MRPEAAALAIASLPLIAARGDAIRLDTDIGSIIGYVVVGLIVGVLARFLLPGRDPVGFLGTLVIGILGAVLGAGWRVRSSPRPRASTGSRRSAWRSCSWRSSGPALGGVSGGR